MSDSSKWRPQPVNETPCPTTQWRLPVLQTSIPTYLHKQSFTSEPPGSSFYNLHLTSPLGQSSTTNPSMSCKTVREYLDGQCEERGTFMLCSFVCGLPVPSTHSSTWSATDNTSSTSDYFRYTRTTDLYETSNRPPYTSRRVTITYEWEFPQRSPPKPLVSCKRRYDGLSYTHDPLSLVRTVPLSKRTFCISLLL